jgi:hypothetical protein
MQRPVEVPSAMLVYIHRTLAIFHLQLMIHFLAVPDGLNRRQLERPRVLLLQRRNKHHQLAILYQHIVQVLHVVRSATTDSADVCSAVQVVALVVDLGEAQWNAGMWFGRWGLLECSESSMQSSLDQDSVGGDFSGFRDIGSGLPSDEQESGEGPPQQHGGYTL